MIGPPEAGQLLIATDPGKGGYFDRSVILILEHNDSGTLGVVLNRPSGHEVPPLLEEWETMLSPPAVPFEGGPISQQAVVALGQLANPPTNRPAGSRCSTTSASSTSIRRSSSSTGHSRTSACSWHCLAGKPISSKAN